jgi:hypothetical protein
VLRHQTIHIGGPLIAITDRLTGHVETCLVGRNGATCKNVEHLETLEERATRLLRASVDTSKPAIRGHFKTGHSVGRVRD